MRPRSYTAPRQSGARADCRWDFGMAFRGSSGDARRDQQSGDYLQCPPQAAARDSGLPPAGFSMSTGEPMDYWPDVEGFFDLAGVSARRTLGAEIGALQAAISAHLYPSPRCLKALSGLRAVGKRTNPRLSEGLGDGSIGSLRVARRRPRQRSGNLRRASGGNGHRTEDCAGNLRGRPERLKNDSAELPRVAVCQA